MKRDHTSYEKLLINRIRKDDREAFRNLFELYYERLCRFVNLIIKDKCSVEGVVQEVFISIWENRRKINIAMSVKSYLYVACKNKALNLLKRKESANLSIHDGDYEKIPAGQTPEDILAFEELNNDFQDTIKKLPQQARRVFILKHFKKTKQKEIAALMNISESTVEKHMGNALRHLRKSLLIHRINL